MFLQKTDVQPLINEGVSKEDIAASVLQAVVIQTISGLACGRPIRGNVAFLGGPLYFLSELRNRFIETLHLTKEQIIFPDNSQLFVAIGAALLSEDEADLSLETVIECIANYEAKTEIKHLPALFNDENEYAIFTQRHKKDSVEKKDLSTYTGDCFLGIDAGSTTTKLALTDDEGNLLYSFYAGNKGNPLRSTIDALSDLYKLLPKDARIAYSAVTGYGEGLLKAALNVDIGEIETIAHYKAADFFCPGVDFILDIGGPGHEMSKDQRRDDRQYPFK